MPDPSMCFEAVERVLFLAMILALSPFIYVMIQVILDRVAR